MGGRYYAIQGECPRCAFDLWKGDLISDDDEAWGGGGGSSSSGSDRPRVACPTCATTYSMRTGTYGPPLKRTGLQALVSGLAKTATANDAVKNAKAFLITVDNDGRVYFR